MSFFWTYFEAANFDETVFDTGDLSTIRGASLALLKLPAQLVEELKPADHILFSSACLMRIEAEKEEAIATSIQEWLDAPPADENDLRATLPELCFSWGTVADNGKFKENYCDARNLSQRNRFKKLTVPARPRGETRRTFGTPEMRKGYYTALLDEQSREIYNWAEISVPKTFEQIVATEHGRSNAPDWLPARMRNKMAVFQFDVNGLGDKFQEKLDSFETLQRASDRFEAAKKKLLADLLAGLVDREKGHLELETLMWGGDEALFIVPCWRLFDVLEMLNEGIKTLTLQDGEDSPTAAVAVVTCNRRTPIRRVKDLLAVMIDDAKALSRDRNLVQYHNVGAFEIPVTSLAAERQRLFGLASHIGRKVMSIPLEDVVAIPAWVNGLFDPADEVASVPGDEAAGPGEVATGPGEVATGPGDEEAGSRLSYGKFRRVLDALSRARAFDASPPKDDAPPAKDQAIDELWKEKVAAENPANGGQADADSKLAEPAKKICVNAPGKFFKTYPFAAILHCAALAPFVEPPRAEEKAKDGTGEADAAKPVADVDEGGA